MRQNRFEDNVAQKAKHNKLGQEHAEHAAVGAQARVADAVGPARRNPHQAQQAHVRALAQRRRRQRHRDKLGVELHRVLGGAQHEQPVDAIAHAFVVLFGGVVQRLRHLQTHARVHHVVQRRHWRQNHCQRNECWCLESIYDVS